MQNVLHALIEYGEVEICRDAPPVTSSEILAFTFVNASHGKLKVFFLACFYVALYLYHDIAKNETNIAPQRDLE